MRTHPLRFAARITLEAATPFLVGRASRDLWDAVWVADANGLPTLPGSSLAGVLRSAMRGRLPASTVDSLFGSAGERGHGSRLSVSWAALHDQSGRPVTGTISPEAAQADPVLRHALQGLVRDHVRLTHIGTAQRTGKFDEAVVGPGHRFTFELELAGSQADEPSWTAILAWFGSGEVTVGGKTRRGLGSFRSVAVRQGVFDLSTADGCDAWARHPTDLGGDSPALRRWDNGPSGDPSNMMTATLCLAPVGLWLFGKGEPEDTEADIGPKSETAIAWDADGRGSVGPSQPLLAGSSIKGALAHRAAFHANAQRLLAAREGAEREALRREILREANNRSANPVARELFGSVRGTDGSGEAGRVRIADVYLAQTPARTVLPHVSVDRFTAGARNGFLFKEETFGATAVEIVARVDRRIGKAAREALHLALILQWHFLNPGNLSLDMAPASDGLVPSPPV